MMINRSLTLQSATSEWLIRYDLTQTIEYSPVSSVLELLASITRSDVVHLYRMDPAAYELRLVSASSTSEDCRIPRVSLQLPQVAKRWMDGMLQGCVVADGDPRFSTFPETVASKVASLLIVPLKVEAQTTAILTLSRKNPPAFGAEEIGIATRLGDTLLVAIKDFDREHEVELLREKLKTIRLENSLLERKLAERKLVERAKGLLQVHFGWTEEDAYYHLRRTSRQQRTPMALIAQRIIDLTAAKELQRERLSA